MESKKKSLVITTVFTVLGIPGSFILFGIIGLLIGMQYGAYQDHDHRPPFISDLPGYEGWGPFYGFIFGMIGVILMLIVAIWKFRQIAKDDNKTTAS